MTPFDKFKAFVSQILTVTKDDIQEMERPIMEPAEAEEIAKPCAPSKTGE
jgi:hypothetical protein